jgi:hypothetical protein
MNSRAKGKRGELEWSAYLRDHLGCTGARRGQQYAGGPDSPDVVGGIPGTHAEVKRVERLNLDKAMDQVIQDIELCIVPYVAHRKNHGMWMVTILADDIRRFCACVAAIDGRPIYPVSSGGEQDAEG